MSHLSVNADSGNVSIGTETTPAKLTVKGGGGFAPALQVSAGFLGPAGVFLGNVGVGVEAPAHMLEVRQTSGGFRAAAITTENPASSRTVLSVEGDHLGAGITTILSNLANNQ